MRKVLFWTHLVVGLTAAVFILIMCVTGVALTYEKQINTWLERRGVAYQAPAAGTARLSLQDLVVKVQEQRPDATPSALVVHADSQAPVEVLAGRQTLLVNPASGEIAGEITPSPARGFFRVMEDGHRWLAMTGSGRETGKVLMDAGNLLFFGLALSGIYLWIPRKISWQHFRPVVMFRGGLSGKARDFNWHNVIGLWTWIPLVLVTASGVIMSYPWASGMLYDLTGSARPANFGKEKGKDKGKEKGGDLRAKGPEGRGPEGEGRGPGGPEGGRGGNGQPADWSGVDRAFARATEQAPDWRIIRIPGSPAAQPRLTLTVDRGAGAQPQYQGRITVERETGTVVRWADFSQLTTGDQLRQLARFTHTGETLGLTGQAIAGLATLGGAFMVYTGIALSLRRFAAWRKRSRTAELAHVA